MKKSIAILLCLLVFFSFSACNQNTPKDSSAESTTGSTTNSWSEPDTVTLSFSYLPPNLEDCISRTSLIVKATLLESSTTTRKMDDYVVGVFWDVYTVTEVLYGEYDNQRLNITYMPYTSIDIDTSSGYCPPDRHREIVKTEGEEYLLLLEFYDDKWHYSDFRFVIPAEDPSSMLVDNLRRPSVLIPIAESEHAVPLTDIDTQEKFLQYALTIIDDAK